MDRSTLCAISFMQPRKSLNFSTALAMSQELDVASYVEDLVESISNSETLIESYNTKIENFKKTQTQNLYFLLADVKEAASLISTTGYLVNLSECYLSTAKNMCRVLEESKDN
jgi:hypothetical protein